MNLSNRIFHDDNAARAYVEAQRWPTLTYPHWLDVPADTWRWPNFSAAEIACRGTGAIKINTEAMDKFQALRDRLGKPLIVRSAYRSPDRAVGGAPASKHMQGTAFDIAMSNHDPAAFEATRAGGFPGFGYYPRSGFMHIDLGLARSAVVAPQGWRSCKTFLPIPRPRSSRWCLPRHAALGADRHRRHDPRAAR